MNNHVEMLREMGVAESNALQCLDELEELLPKYRIASSKTRLAHFFSRVLHESGFMRFDTENLN